MRNLMRVAPLALLLALFFQLTLTAQEDEFAILGSGIALPAIEAVSESYEGDFSITATVTGTTNGIASFCVGEGNAVVTNRPLTAAEDASCLTNGVEYSEFLIGHSIMAVIANPDADFLTCVSSAELDMLFAPSSTESTLTWDQVNAEYPNTDIQVILPPINTLPNLLLDDLVAGAGFRADAIVSDDGADSVSTVMDTEGAIAVVDLRDVDAEAVRLVDVRFPATTDCATPSIENFESRLYTGGQRFFMYINATEITNEAVVDWLTFAVSAENEATINELGLIPPSGASFERNQVILNDGLVGRQFSQDVVTYEIPQTVAGDVILGGAAHAFGFFNVVTTGVPQIYPNITITSQLEGETAGVRRFCNGEIDIVVTRGGIAEEQVENCESNAIETLEYDMGQRVAVLVANANAEYAACLTTEQINTIWSAESTEAVLSWSDVDDSFPEQEMTLFGITEGSPLSDLLLTSENGTAVPIRIDTELDGDPLYRAAATANVDAAITYMSWSDYQSVLENEQANIQLVQIDTGDGCITPDETTLADGTYPLTESATLIINKESLANPAVQAFVWVLFSNENHSSLGFAGFSGLEFGDLPEIRVQLQREFTVAEEAALQAAAAEVTPEPAPEVEATDEP